MRGRSELALYDLIELKMIAFDEPSLSESVRITQLRTVLSGLIGNVVSEAVQARLEYFGVNHITTSTGSLSPASVSELSHNSRGGRHLYLLK